MGKSINENSRLFNRKKNYGSTDFTLPKENDINAREENKPQFELQPPPTKKITAFSLCPPPNDLLQKKIDNINNEQVEKNEPRIKCR